MFFSFFRCFFHFFWILIILVIMGSRGSNKGAKNSPKWLKICLLHSISQEPYIIWLSFMLHLCKMIISPGLFFSFSKFWFFGLLGGKMAKSSPKLTKNSVHHTSYLRNHTWWPVTFSSVHSNDDQDQGGWRAFSKDPQSRSWGKVTQKNSIVKISKVEFGLIKVLFYSLKSQNFYGIILLQKRSPWFWKKLNHSVLIVSWKCLVLTWNAHRLS